jgi:hypothetical protein
MGFWLLGLQTWTSENKKAEIKPKKRKIEEFGRVAKQI